MQQPVSTAYKKYGSALLRKLSPLGFQNIKIGDTSSGSLVANDFWPIAQRLQASFTSEDERFEKMIEVVSSYDAFKQKYADVQGEDLAQFKRFATKEFDAYMLALKMLVSVPSHNGILDVALLEQHFANISGIAPSRFKMEFNLQRASNSHINFILRPPTDAERAESPDLYENEKNKFFQFHDALMKLGVIRASSLKKIDSSLTISQVDLSPVLALAQFEMPDQSAVRSPSRRKAAAVSPAPDKKFIEVAVHLQELLKTENDFAKQMQALSGILDVRGYEGCQVLLRQTEGVYQAAKQNLEQKIPNLHELLEENVYIIRANFPPELKLTDAEEYVLTKLEQYYLLKNAITIFQSIALKPYAWLDKDLVVKILDTKPEDITHDDLRSYLTTLCNNIEAKKSEVASYLVDLRWITVHFNDLRKILNDRDIVKFDDQTKIPLGIKGHKEESIEKTEQEIINTYLIAPVQRLPRYDMVLKELMMSFNKVTLDGPSSNNFNVLNGLIFLRKYFLARNKSTNERCRKHEQDQAQDKPKKNEQNKPQSQDPVGVFFSALNAFFSRVEDKSSVQAVNVDSVKDKSNVQGGNAGSFDWMYESTREGLSEAPGVVFNPGQSSLFQSNLEQHDGDQHDVPQVNLSQSNLFQSSFNSSQLFFSSLERSTRQADKVEIEAAQKKEIKLEILNEEEIYKSLKDALIASEGVHENPLKNLAPDNSDDEDPPKKPVKVVLQSDQSAPVVEMKDEFSLHIYRPLALAPIQEVVQSFGPFFDKTQASISLKEVKSKVVLAGGGTYFDCKPDLKSQSKSMPGLQKNDKVVWYIDVQKEDPAAVSKWVQDTWRDMEKYRGYFIIVGHGDVEAFKDKWDATPLVVEKVIPSVFQQPNVDPDKKANKEPVPQFDPQMEESKSPQAEVPQQRIAEPTKNELKPIDFSADIPRFDAQGPDTRPLDPQPLKINDAKDKLEAAPIVEIDGYSLLYIPADPSGGDSQSFGPYFHKGQKPLDIAKVKSAILAKSNCALGFNFDLDEGTYKTTNLTNPYESHKKVWYINSKQALAVNWIQQQPPRQHEKGYFIVVSHGDCDFAAFKREWDAVPTVVEKVIPPVLQSESQKKSENPVVEAVNPVPRTEPEKLNSNVEPKKHQDAQHPDPEKILDQQQQAKRDPEQKKPTTTLPPGVKPLRETLPPSGKGAPLLVADDNSDVEIVNRVVKKSPAPAKTFFKGFFNPSVWGIALLLSMAVGMSAQTLVGFSEPFFNIVMSIGVTALPVFAGLWAISAVVYLGRLALREDPANGKPKNEPSDVYKGMVGFGMTVGAAAIVAGAILMIMGGVPSELPFIKPVFDVIGHFLSTGLKVMGLDTLSNVFAVGGEISSGVTAFLIIAAPVLFTLILAERLVTKYFFSGEGVGVSQKQDAGNGFRSVPKQPEKNPLQAAKESLFELIANVELQIQLESLSGNQSNRPRVEALRNLQSKITNNISKLASTDEDSLVAKQHIESVSQHGSSERAVFWETKNSDFLKEQIGMITTELKVIDDQYPVGKPEAPKGYSSTSMLVNK